MPVGGAEVKCGRCGKPIGTKEKPAYQVRAGYADDDDEFIPDEDVGYYCGECLAKGVH